MKILIDECIDWRLKREFGFYEVKTVQDMGWIGKKNGELLDLAASEKFDVFITIDKILQYQIDPKKYPFSIIVLITFRSTLTYLKPLIPEVIKIFSTIKPGEISEVTGQR